MKNCVHQLRVSLASFSEHQPVLHISKLGIVSRDYRKKFENGYRDFSHVFPDVLNLLDSHGCDSVLFSLYSLIPRDDFNVNAILRRQKNIRAVFIEEFSYVRKRKVIRNVVYYRDAKGWQEYELQQQFGSLTSLKREKMDHFVDSEIPLRVMGNSCLLLCGETNGVKYSPKDKKVHDTFDFRASIPEQANVILNPIHDRMSRFEMKFKRRFLSENKRWVVSVWNKGKADVNGVVKDGKALPITIFYDGEEQDLKAIPNDMDLEIAILDCGWPPNCD